MRKAKKKSLLFFLIRLGITCTLLYFLYQKTDLQKLKEVFKHLKIFYYGVAVLLCFLFQAVLSFRWQLICKSWNISERFFFFYKTYLISFTFNTAFPGIVGGDLLRVYYLTKAGLDWKKATFSVFLDRALGLAGILTILVVVTFFFGGFLPVRLLWFIRILFLLGFIAFLGIFYYNMKSTPKELLNPLKPAIFLKAYFLGIFVQLIFLGEFIFLGKALSLPVPLKYYLVIIPIVSFLSALPISISGLGVREGSLSFFFSLLKYPLEYGISLGLLGYTLILIGSTPGIYLYLKERKK